MIRTRLLVAGFAGLVAAATLLGFVLRAGSASATAEARVRPFAASHFAPLLERGIAESARAAGAPAPSLVEIGAAGDSGSRAGLVVGRSAEGDVVCLFTPINFTSFTTPQRLLRGNAVAAYVSIQPSTDGKTGHVQLSGLAAPRVRRAVLKLADGSTLDAQLVRAGNAGFEYFAYVTDDPGTFPEEVHAYGADGAEIDSYDLRGDIAAPRAP